MHVTEPENKETSLLGAFYRFLFAIMMSCAILERGGGMCGNYYMWGGSERGKPTRLVRLYSPDCDGQNFLGTVPKRCEFPMTVIQLYESSEVSPEYLDERGYNRWLSWDFNRFNSWRDIHLYRVNLFEIPDPSPTKIPVPPPYEKSAFMVEGENVKVRKSRRLLIA